MADLKVDPNNGLARAGLRGETRTIGKPELRAAGENTPQKIGGYAAVFNSPTSIRDVFMEVIAPGAFTTTIAKNDIRALFNHDPEFRARPECRQDPAAHRRRARPGDRDRSS